MGGGLVPAHCWLVWLTCAATALNTHSDRSQVLHQMGVKLTNDVPSVTVSSVASSSVDLPCNLTGHNSQDKVRLVLWFKNDSAKPIYTYDTRGKSHEDARHWSDDKMLEGRAFFRGDLNPGRLVLDNSQPQDEGVYKCRVDFKKAPTRISEVNLEVIIPPEKPIIYDDSNQQVRLKLGPYRIGESVMIKCSCLGGRPSPIITWWRDHHLVDDSYEQVSQSKVTNLLALKSLRREDLHSILTCQASNNNVSVPVSTSVKLDMTFGPTSVRLLGMKQSLSAGVGYDVQCQTIGARPIPKITWFKRGKQLPTSQNDQTSPDGNVTMSTIRLTPSKDDDGSILTCRASLQHLPDSNMEASWNIRVNYSPTAKLTLGSSLDPHNIKEGDDVYFECVIKSNPRPHLITWKKDGVALRHDVKKGVIISNQSLVLQRISRSETGTYTCHAHNSEGDGHSNEVTLNIRYAPVCRPGQMLLYGVARHEVTHVSCQVMSNPSANLTFEWVFNTTSERLDIQQSQFSNSGGTKSIVEYIPRTEMDYGSLLCWAVNSVGRQETPCVYHLIPAGHPDPVSNCSINNQSHSSFSLDCQSGFDGGLQQTFVMEVIDSEAGYVVTNMSSQTPSFSVNGLQSGKTFFIKVFSANDKGYSEPISLTAFTLEAKEAERRTDLGESGLLRTRFTITPILGVLIGVGAALGLVSVSIILIICWRTRLETKNNHRSQFEQTRLALDMREEQNSLSRIENKSPDIIPISAEFQDEEAAFKQYNERKYSTLHSPQFKCEKDYEALNTIRNNISRLGQEVSYSEPRHPRGVGYSPMLPHHGAPASCIYAKHDPSKKTAMEIRSFHNTSSSSSHSLRRPDSPGDGLSDVSVETPLVSSSSEDGRSSSASAPQCPVPGKVLEGLNRESAV